MKTSKDWFTPDVEKEYNGMFAVSNIKAIFSLGNNMIKYVNHTNNGTYDLKNLNIYNEATSEIVKKGTQKDYNSQFLVQLGTIDILDVKPFLDYHLKKSNNKQAFFDFVKYVALSSNKEIKTVIKDWIKQQPNIEPLPPQPIKTKTDILNEQLSKYGFFELEKVKTLSEQSKVSIIEKIAESGLPYAIAMFDYLQYISYLEKKHFDSKYKLNREVSKWFDSDKEGRAVKGNISSLLKNTTENKDRYTAYRHKENVIKDFEQLK